MEGMADVAKLAIEHWPNLAVTVLAVSVAVKIVRFEGRVRELEKLAAAEFEWRKEHERTARKHIDNLQELTTDTRLLQQQVTSLAESLGILRDAQLESQKHIQAGLGTVIALRQAGLIKMPEGT